MPEYLDDPSVLTKDKLKSELLAHNVELPSGNQTKDVYVQLYLKNLTVQNKKHVTATTLDAFSSDEELPPPVVFNRSRSSGRKATRKTDKVHVDELDVTMLTDEGLRDELLKQGVDAGPIVASTRKLYERKLQKLLDDGPVEPQLPQVVVTDIQVSLNGKSESELYSDMEDEVTTPTEPQPAAEPEVVPLVEKPVRSRGKTPITTRTRSSQHHAVEKITASDQNPKVEKSDILKELFPNDMSSPTGITATCRRPIRGAAGRPLKSSDLWNNENCLFTPKNIKTSISSSSTESHVVNRIASLPQSNSPTTAPPARQTKAGSRNMSFCMKLFLLAIVAAFLFLVYQAMETNTINPFGASDTDVVHGSATSV
ncbi:thymopoietin a isoform X2 [Echeneis naucrates]|uniref:thymopoietin a isoform X2 n=1 Tax=Echeneis naucrates TaxID=173247 RepID=UPI00111445B7|nr:lamina-associated polypeptide 2, isoforms beta/gamma-like isoform X2 [Echeneis naucrates]